MTAPVLSVVSQKGGVGKTTTAINLAAVLARRGVKTLLIDVDPQGAVRHGLGLGADVSAGLADVLAGTHELADAVQPTALPWLRVLLAGSVTDSADHGDYQDAVATSPRLDTLLERARSRGYLVIVDTPPGLGAVTRRMLACSQHVLVPLQAEPLALQTTSQILRAIREASVNNPALVLDGLLLTMTDARSEVSRRVADYVKSQLPAELLLDVEIPRTEAATDAFAAGQPVVLRAPEDPAAVAYGRLADLLQARLR